MAKPRSKDGPRGSQDPRSVVRRPREERKRLSPELERLASGEEDRIYRPRRPRLRDPRTVALVPGVANRDARRVYDAREAALRAALAGGDDGEVDRLLAEAVLLGAWRGKSLSGFDAFVEEVLGLAAAEARDRAVRGGAALGVGELERLTDEGVAAWMRIEAALLEENVAGAQVAVRLEGRKEVIHLALPVDPSPAALLAIGRRMVPLARDRDRR